LIEQLVELAGACSEDAKAELSYKLTCTVSAFRAQRLADKQESPARIVAALEPGAKAAKELLEWLASMPVGVLIELQAGGLDEHLVRIIDRTNYWQRHVEAHRPAGKAAASLELQFFLRKIYAEHCLSLRYLKAEERERRLRDLVAQASKLIGEEPNVSIGIVDAQGVGPAKPAEEPAGTTEDRLKDAPI
jgi:hypothetical protein